MSREKKKGTSGNARAYITRAKALKKLQLSLQEFRRLCIVKGIYPRDPRKKVDGTDKTYYLRKDIDFLAHERLIGTLRAQKTHRKKVVKARAKRQRDVLRSLAQSAPKARLDHIVLERYPQFADALRELDDPLCIVAMFAHLPANHKFGVASHRVNTCKKLLNEFHHFVVATGALRKVFVSIKGYYYQAVIQGEVITWISPHRFTQVLPSDVDYTVMLTFLDLYKCILSFVNFKLYTGQNMAYPPKFSRDLMAKGLELGAVHDDELKPKKTYAAVVPEPVEVEEAVSKDTLSAVAASAANMDARDDESDEENDENDDKGDAAEENTGGDKEGEELDMEENNLEKLSVFEGKSIVIGRETPFIELEFVLKSAGAMKVTREDDLPDVTVSDRLDGYTHWIVDRPTVRGPQNMSVEYVQPQYVFDSVNNGVLLPPSLYGIGMKLPPHLSPFVTDEADGGYRPWFKDVLEKIKAGDETVVEDAAAVVYAQDKVEKEALAEIEGAKAGDDKESSDAVEKKKSSRRRPKKIKGKKKSTDAISVVTAETGEDAEDKSDEDGKSDGSDVEGVKGNESEKDEDMAAESSEEDEEDDEMEDAEAEKKVEKNEKDMAKIMMSRKKARKYQHVIREAAESEARKDKLMAKRQAIEMNAQQTGTKRKKRKAKK